MCRRYFSTAEAAARAYDREAAQRFGRSYAKLNFPLELPDTLPLRAPTPPVMMPISTQPMQGPGSSSVPGLTAHFVSSSNGSAERSGGEGQNSIQAGAPPLADARASSNAKGPPFAPSPDRRPPPKADVALQTVVSGPDEIALRVVLKVLRARLTAKGVAWSATDSAQELLRLDRMPPAIVEVADPAVSDHRSGVTPVVESKSADRPDSPAETAAQGSTDGQRGEAQQVDAAPSPTAGAATEGIHDDPSLSETTHVIDATCDDDDKADEWSQQHPLVTRQIQRLVYDDDDEIIQRSLGRVVGWRAATQSVSIGGVSSSSPPLFRIRYESGDALSGQVEELELEELLNSLEPLSGKQRATGASHAQATPQHAHPDRGVWEQHGTGDDAAKRKLPPRAARFKSLSSWRTDNAMVGRKIARCVYNRNGAIAEKAIARVVGWLPADESDYQDDQGRPAPLYHICYESGELDGDFEVRH